MTTSEGRGATPARAKRRLAFAGLLAVLIVVASVVASEVAFRTMRRLVCDGRGGGFHERNADYGWGHVPGIRTESHGCLGRNFEFRVDVQTGSKGLMGPDRDYAKAPGTSRILVLGDSVVEAAQVESDQAFPVLLEKRLSSPAAPVEVLNAGVAGFSTHNEILFYRAEGAKYSPDIVLSEFNLQNDVGELSPAMHRREYAGPDAFATADVSVARDGTLRIDTAPYAAAVEEQKRKEAEANPVDFWLWKNVYLYRRLKHAIGGQEYAGTPPPAPALGTSSAVTLYQDPEPAEWQDAWKLAEAAYRTLAGDVAARGAQFVVFVMPSREMVSDEAWQTFQRWPAGPPPAGSRWAREAPRERALAMLDRLGIRYVDLTPPLRDAIAKTGRSGFFEFDLHPTAEGHQRIADALAPVLAERLAAAHR